MIIKSNARTPILNSLIGKSPIKDNAKRLKYFDIIISATTFIKLLLKFGYFIWISI